MLKRLKLGTGAVLGLAALALGGSAIAAANPASSHAHRVSLVSRSAEPTGPDTDNVQSGDQTTPDATRVSHKSASESTGGPDTDNVQSGDQTSPDSSRASKAGTAGETSGENAGESTGENATPSDGPGGYADPAGNANTQQQGQN